MYNAEPNFENFRNVMNLTEEYGVMSDHFCSSNMSEHRFGKTHKIPFSVGKIISGNV